MFDIVVYVSELLADLSCFRASGADEDGAAKDLATDVLCSVERSLGAIETPET